MPLEPQTIELSLAGGVDLKTDPRLVQAPNNLQAVNVRWPSAGAVDQRFGQTVLPTTVGGSQTVELQSVSGPSVNLLNYNESTTGGAGSTANWVFINNLGVYNSPTDNMPTLTILSVAPWGAPAVGNACLHSVSTQTGIDGAGQDAAVILFPCLGSTTYTFSAYVG